MARAIGSSILTLSLGHIISIKKSNHLFYLSNTSGPVVEVAGGDNRHSGASTGGYTRYFGGSRALVHARIEPEGGLNPNLDPDY